LQGARHPFAGVIGKAMGDDQTIEVLDRNGADPDPRHSVVDAARLEVVQSDGVAGEATFQSELRPLVCALDPVQQRSSVSRLWISFFDRRR
jgi:hypothetical protein